MKLIKDRGYLRVPENTYADFNEVKSFKDRTIETTHPIFIYRNLHRKDIYLYSIKQFGKVVAHATRLCLSNCQFYVNEKTRQRILRTKQKEVCAVIEGSYTTSGMGTSAERNDLPAIISFNPYKNEHFMCLNLTKAPFSIKGARFIICDKDGVKGSYLIK